MLKPKVIISACLLGEYCRYDGKIKKDNSVVEAFKNYEIIPFCPEAPLFGTPRQRINLIQINGKSRAITDETDKDITLELENEINSFCEKNRVTDVIILKSKSPSCGIGTTAILNEKKEISRLGDGLAIKILKDKYPNAKIRDEHSI